MLSRQDQRIGTRSRRFRRRRPKPAPSARNVAAPLPIRTMGVRFGDLTPIPTDRRVDPEPFHCFNCWQRGHDALQCARPQVMPFCHNCGRRGVNMVNCPRCRAAYRRRLEAPPRIEDHRHRSRSRQGTSRERPQPHRRTNVSERERLGPPVTPPERRMTEVQEAISVCSGLQRYTTEVGEAVLRRLYMRQWH